MKKHFLLLVMALMSLTGWAQTATIGEVAIGEYTYGAWALPTDAVVKDSEGAILTKGTHYTISVDAFSDEACETAVADLASLKADGTTKYYRLITGIGAYAGQKKAVWFKVAKADATIHLADALSKNYGENDPAIPTTAGAYTITYQRATSETNTEETLITDQFEGTLAYSYVGENAGEYALTFSGITPKATGIGANFNLVTTDKITINPLDISGTATITAWQGDVEYTGNPFVGVYTVKDKAEGGIVLEAGTKAVEATLESPAVPATGDYYVDAVTNVNWSGTGVVENRPTIHFQGNYTGTITVAEGKGFKVTPAPLAVTVEDYEVDYDNVNHAVLKAPAEGTTPEVEAPADLKFVYSGFLGADIQPEAKATLIAAFTAPTKVAYDGEAINAGEYALTISGGTAGVGNYEFKNYLPGKLIINPKKVELTSKSESKMLGEKDPDFVLNAAPAFVAGTGDYIKDGTLTFDRQDSDKEDKVGKFTITPNTSAIVVLRPAATPGAAPTDVTANYSVVAAEEGQGQLTITAAGIVISIKDASKKYGETDPTKFDYVVTGLQEGDKLAEVNVTRDKAGTTAGEAAGAYLLTATAPANPDKDKYASVTVVPAIFTIAQAELEITMPTQSVAKTEGKAADLKKDGITAKGINNADKIADLIKNLEFYPGVTVAADKTWDPGYKATLTDAAKKNYKFTKVNGVAVADPNTADVACGKLIVGAGTAEAINFTSTDGDAEADPVVPSDYSLIKGHAGETQNVRLTIAPRFVREVPAGKKHGWAAQTWNTMVLPFEVSVADLSAQLGYAIVNVVDPSKTTEDNVQFKLEMDKIPANTPFCVKTSQALTTKKEGGEDKPYFLDFEGVKIVDAGEYVSVDAGLGYKFVGAYKTKTIDKTTPTYNFLRGDNAKWAHIGGTSANSWTVVPFDAYVELTEAAAARGVTFTFEELDGSYTAIKAIEVNTKDIESAKTGWYTIGGVKLQSAPSQKGVYIKDGKKIVVK